MEGGERMSAAELRLKLLQILCIRRHDTYQNLAEELGVTKETIRQDVIELMRYYPVETRRGRYGGGVWIADGYYLTYNPSGKKELSAEQTAALKRAISTADARDGRILNSILIQFASHPLVL